jgi:hypothetical protein
MIEKEPNHYHDSSSLNSVNSNSFNNNNSGSGNTKINSSEGGGGGSGANNLEIQGSHSYNEDTIHKVCENYYICLRHFSII